MLYVDEQFEHTKMLLRRKEHPKMLCFDLISIQFGVHVNNDFRPCGSFQEITLQWSPPPEGLRNGALTEYVVSFRPEDKSKDSTQYSNNSGAVIRGTEQLIG